MVASLRKIVAPLLNRASASAVRALSSSSSVVVHKLPQLPYSYDALEPSISAEIMELHHSKHHQTYVNNLNNLLQKVDSTEDLAEKITIEAGIRFNGGGHLNHSIFWTNLAPSGSGGGGQPNGPLAEAIASEFGSFEKFQAKFNAKTAAVQGSGWGWLGYNKETGRVEIATTLNQDPLLLAKGLIPLLAVDVWEHAYYLQYKNVRPDYLNAIWDVVNWSNVADRFADASN